MRLGRIPRLQLVPSGFPEIRKHRGDPPVNVRLLVEPELGEDRVDVLLKEWHRPTNGIESPREASTGGAQILTLQGYSAFTPLPANARCTFHTPQDSVSVVAPIKGVDLRVAIFAGKRLVT